MGYGAAAAPGYGAGGAGRSGRGGLLALIGVTVAIVLGLIVTAVILLLPDDDGSTGASGRLKTPIAIQQVTGESPGACPATGGVPAGDGKSCLRLGGGGLVLREVEKIAAQPPEPARGQNSWSILIGLRPADAKAFGDLTVAATKDMQGAAGYPRLAIVVGGRVVSAPQIQQPITGGQIQINGPDFTRARVDRLVTQLTGKD